MIQDCAMAARVAAVARCTACPRPRPRPSPLAAAVSCPLSPRKKSAWPKLPPSAAARCIPTTRPYAPLRRLLTPTPNSLTPSDHQHLCVLRVLSNHARPRAHLPARLACRPASCLSPSPSLFPPPQTPAPIGPPSAAPFHREAPMPPTSKLSLQSPTARLSFQARSLQRGSPRLLRLSPTSRAPAPVLAAASFTSTRPVVGASMSVFVSWTSR